MEINIHDDKKMVEVWLTRAEKQDEALQQELKPLYTQYKKKKYMVAVFESGEQDLYQNTLALLSYNKRRIPELEMMREKQMRQAVAE